MQADRRFQVPRTDALLESPAARAAVSTLGRRFVKGVVHEVQDAVRAGTITPEQVDTELSARLARGLVGIRRVLNATGVIVHTNLGRAPLSKAALTAIEAAAGTCDLELDLRTGRRGRRGESLDAALLSQVAPARGVHVVNNGAAAIALVTAVLGRGGEVLLSRGELIEIGAGFRLPDLIEAAGARIREVGTTNRTHLRDYQDAIGPDTRMIFKIHPSNYRVDGFTAGVSVAELSTLGLPVVSDIGSGLLRAHPMLPDEPDATSHLQAGAAIVTSSGDKLLGGPQAGLLFTATEDLAATLKRHPMARAYRADKLALAALEATVLGPEPPVLQMLHASASDLRSRAEEAVHELTTGTPMTDAPTCDDRTTSARSVAGTATDASTVGGVAAGAAHSEPVGLDCAVVDTVATVGGGGAPGVELPSWGISLPAAFAAALRDGPVPVMTRVEGGRCIVDLRTIAVEDQPQLLTSIRHAAARVDSAQ